MARFKGEKLRDLRVKRGMSMAELTKIAGVAQGYISQIEAEKKNPGHEVVEKISKALGLDDPLFFYMDNYVLPGDLITNLPADIVEFISNGDSVPYLVLAADAKKENISPEAMAKIIEALRYTKK